jgi:hypothetical protein
MSIQSNFPNLKPSLLLDFANTKQLDNRITFTRSTPAVYYDGKTTAMAEQNALLYSQDLSNANWLYNNITISVNTTTAPDGTTTADTISDNSSDAYHRLYQPIDAFTQLGAYSFSIYLKYKDHRYISCGLTDNSYYRAQVVVDLVNGTITQNYLHFASDVLTSAITSVGNGWYRLTGTFTANTAIVTKLYLLSTLQQSGTFNAFNYVGTGTGFYAWGVQAEQRNASTAYTVTTSQPITNYIPVLLTAGGNQPRFDCNPITGESLGLFVEEQRTNIVTYSATFDNWTKPNVSFSTEVIAPDGTLTGQKVISTTTGSNSGAYRVSSGSNTISMYAKAAGKNWLAFINTSGSNFVAFFNVSTGTVGAVGGGYTASITAVGNGWFRCVLTAGTGTFAYHQWCICDQDNDSSVTANSVNGVLVWGAQAEAGLFATSYIPTTSASATRTADAASMTGTNFSSWYSQGNGTFYAEASTASVASDVMIIEGTNSGGGFLDFSMTFATTSTQFINRYVSTNNDMRKSGAVSANTMVKFSGSITGSTGTTIAATNGTTAASVGSQGANFGADRMFIGSRGGSSLFLNAPIRKLSFYPAQLTQTQQNSITG